MCGPRVYLPQILTNPSEIGTENLHFNKLTRDSGAAGLWMTFRERTGSILLDSIHTIKKKKKALRAVFRHLTRHLTFENNSRTFHRGLSFQEAKKRQLPQHWCLQKNAKNFFRTDTPYSIHSLPRASGSASVLEAQRKQAGRMFPGCSLSPILLVPPS